VLSLYCELRHLGKLSFAIRHSHNLDRDYERRFFKEPLLNPEVPSLLFAWDLSVNSSILDKHKLFSESGSGSKAVRLTSQAVQDADAIYAKRHQAVFVRLYTHVLRAEDRGLRAPKHTGADLATVSLMFDPASDRPALGGCYLSFNIEQADGSLMGHSVDCAGSDKTLEVSAGFKKGNPVALRLRGKAEADSRVKRPHVVWDLQVKTQIEGVFDE
jgi:hypothetical protein